MEKKKKEPKKKIVPFDKIDITTATEDEIIRSGLKHKTAGDSVCYFVMFLIFVAAILPLALRIIIPRPITTEERDVLYSELRCYKALVRDGWELSTTITGSYRDGEVKKMNIEYSYAKRVETAEDNYSFEEIVAFDKIDLKGVTADKKPGKAIYSIDFTKYPELKNTEELKEYSYVASQQTLVFGELGLSCSNDSHTEREVVYIDTGEKVE